MPTPKPTAIAMMMFCSGNAMDTAVSASSQMRETKILSTMLYSACTSMEIIIGTAIDSRSLFSGIVPILFSRRVSCAIVSLPLYQQTNKNVTNRYYKLRAEKCQVLLHFSLENDTWPCYNNCTCGISSLVEHLLPKQDRRVRFPYPAPRTAAESASAAVFLRSKSKQPDAYASGCFVFYTAAISRARR